ncbi:HEAT repeat domain-containing protein [Luteolibacter soli]|uniref:HEAT repeat domain-containing protein n=1 Tax=Luteolibacter soli TaxID=3135280 RepID=A0ABU9AQ08_9BACT
MKSFLIISGLALWTIFVAITSSKSSDASPTVVTGQEPAKRQQTSAKLAERDSSGRAQTKPATDAERLVTARAIIESAALRYEPSAVKDIRPWLLDTDPEIRQAARDGLVMLGESDAIPFLRDAASRLKDPAEIASFHEAADLLSLPAWSDSEEARRATAEIVSEADR